MLSLCVQEWFSWCCLQSNTTAVLPEIGWMHDIQQQLFRWTGFWCYIIWWLSLRLLQQQHTTSRIHSSTTWHIWSEQCLLCPTKQTWTAVQGLHWWVWPFSCYNWLCLCKLHSEQLWVDAVHPIRTHSCNCLLLYSSHISNPYHICTNELLCHVQPNSGIC